MMNGTFPILILKGLSAVVFGLLIIFDLIFDG
jgi:hypothetical protein